MNKTAIKIIAAAAVLGGGTAAFLYFVPPYFVVRTFDWGTKTGEFQFGRKSYKFSTTTGMNVGGRMGYSVSYEVASNGNIVFSLYQHGRFKKKLQTISKPNSSVPITAVLNQR